MFYEVAKFSNRKTSILQIIQFDRRSTVSDILNIMTIEKIKYFNSVYLCTYKTIVSLSVSELLIEPSLSVSLLGPWDQEGAENI